MENINTNNSRNNYIDLHYNKKSSYFSINVMKIIFKYLLITFIGVILIGIITFGIVNSSKGQEFKISTIPKKELICEKGYYKTLDDGTCQKCKIENCKDCYGTKLSNSCTSCFKDYEPIFKNNSIISCEIKSYLNCFNYDISNKICLKCNNGYYIVNDEKNKTICKN